ncbi:hypothetical protein EDD15DRAFT_2379763 [Pisolithus albus]|nr:hypothetical protein EDD15DRAFT_2379763 [Pisolithus albus]
MFEPTLPVIFHIPSPRPPGIELEPDCPPIRRQFFSSPQASDSGTSCGVSVGTAFKHLASDVSFVVSSEPQYNKEHVRRAHPEEVCLSTEYCRRASIDDHNAAMTQKTPAGALQADVPKVTLGSTSLFQKSRKAIRSREEVTSWYRSQSSMPMGEPPLSSHLYSEALCESDLFINVFSGGVKAWIWKGKIWAPIKEGDPHPHISGYCVSFLQAGEPSWVTKRTIATYRSKRRR